MRFIEKLRERGINHTDRSASGVPLPTGLKFTPEEWIAAYEVLSDGSIEDRNAFEAGLFLFERMKRVREELNTMSKHVSTFPGNDRAVGLCGLLNSNLKQLINNSQTHQNQEVMVIEHALSAREFGAFPDSLYTAEEVIQSLVDGTKLPLRLALTGKDLGVDTPLEPIIDHGSTLINEMILGSIYHSFESLWQAVQWAGSRLHCHGLEYLFDETEQPHIAESRLDMFRRMQRFSKDGLSLMPKVENQTVNFTRVPLVKGNSITTCTFEKLIPEARRRMHAIQSQRAATTALEVTPFEKVIHPKLEITIGKLIDIWTNLSFIASCCLSETEDQPAKAPSHLASNIANARKFPKLQLVEVIAKCTGLKNHNVEKALQHFTFSLGPNGGKQDELWDRPLIPTNNDLILVWAPLIACEYTRLISRFTNEASQLREAYAAKGHRFEEHVVQAIRIALTKSPINIRQNIKVLQARIDPHDKRVGDVDAILVIGNTAFVMECRTLRNASTPYEHWDVANDLLKNKGPQALRKRDYLLENTGWLDAISLKQGIALNQKINRYVAVVVSNSYMFEGFKDDEPYYIHVDTLLNTFLNGGPRFGDIVEGKECEYIVDFFGNFTDPAEAVLRAISKPVKAEMYHQCLKIRNFPIPSFGKGDYFGSIQQWTMNFPELGHVRSLLDRCSFAHMLREVKPFSP